MSDSNGVCPYAQDADIETRYLTGQLPEADAEAFEAHYFSCDRCFTLVERGAELRAAVGSSDVGVAAIRRRSTHLRTWAAAAATIVIAAAVWRIAPPTHISQAPSAIGVDVVRGDQGTFTIATRLSDTLLLAFWAPRAGATRYRVRLLTANGVLVFERETADTGILLPIDSLRAVRARAPVYWQVQALDALRGVLATSPAVQAPLRHAKP